jgi:hypothetical protein
MAEKESQNGNSDAAFKTCIFWFCECGLHLGKEEDLMDYILFLLILFVLIVLSLLMYKQYSIGGLPFLIYFLMVHV